MGLAAKSVRALAMAFTRVVLSCQQVPTTMRVGAEFSDDEVIAIEAGFQVWRDACPEAPVPRLVYGGSASIAGVGEIVKDCEWLAEHNYLGTGAQGIISLCPELGDGPEYGEALEYVVAHELGHIMGLADVDDRSRLMHWESPLLPGPTEADCEQFR
jgi:hypothetical protein